MAICPATLVPQKGLLLLLLLLLYVLLLHLLVHLLVLTLNPLLKALDLLLVKLARILELD